MKIVLSRMHLSYNCLNIVCFGYWKLFFPFKIFLESRLEGFFRYLAIFTCRHHSMNIAYIVWIIYSYIRSSAKVKPINRKEASHESKRSRENLVRLPQNPFQKKIRFVLINRSYPKFVSNLETPLYMISLQIRFCHF